MRAARNESALDTLYCLHAQHDFIGRRAARRCNNAPLSLDSLIVWRTHNRHRPQHSGFGGYLSIPTPPPKKKKSAMVTNMRRPRLSQAKNKNRCHRRTGVRTTSRLSTEASHQSDWFANILKTYTHSTWQWYANKKTGTAYICSTHAKQILLTTVSPAHRTYPRHVVSHLPSVYIPHKAVPPDLTVARCGHVLQQSYIASTRSDQVPRG